MVIQTLDKGYTVIKYCEAGAKVERYICRDVEKDTKCTIVRIKDKSLIQDMTEYYGERLKDCFVSEEHLHLVFEHHEGMTLEDKLKNEVCVQESRLALGKKILEQMVIQDMPVYFQCDALKKGNVILKTETEIVFNHSLENIEQFKRSTFQDVNKAVAAVLELLFAKELKKHLIPGLNDFRKNLKKGTYTNYLVMLDGYNRVLDEVGAMTSEELVTPKTRRFRVWGTLRKGLKPLKKLIAVLLLVAAAVYLGYTIKDYVAPAKGQESIDSIGTLEIKGDTR